MVTNIAYGYSIEYRGLSTDDKPTPLDNGAVFLEMDTGDVYLYDKENNEWLKLTK